MLRYLIYLIYLFTKCNSVILNNNLKNIPIPKSNKYTYKFNITLKQKKSKYLKNILLNISNAKLNDYEKFINNLISVPKNYTYNFNITLKQTSTKYINNILLNISNPKLKNYRIFINNLISLSKNKILEVKDWLKYNNINILNNSIDNLYINGTIYNIDKLSNIKIKVLNENNYIIFRSEYQYKIHNLKLSIELIEGISNPFYKKNTIIQNRNLRYQNNHRNYQFHNDNECPTGSFCGFKEAKTIFSDSLINYLELVTLFKKFKFHSPKKEIFDNHNDNNHNNNNNHEKIIIYNIINGKNRLLRENKNYSSYIKINNTKEIHNIKGINEIYINFFDIMNLSNASKKKISNIINNWKGIKIPIFKINNINKSKINNKPYILNIWKWILKLFKHT